jgi:hypothetical protein
VCLSWSPIATTGLWPTIRSATAKYYSLSVAKKAGYSILADAAGITCIAEPQMGAMGVHYVKGDQSRTLPSMQSILKPWSLRLTDMAVYTWQRWSMW